MRMIKSITARFGREDAVIRKFLKGSFWAVYGNIAVKGFSLISSMIIARWVGSDTFGQLSIIKTTLSVFSLFATFGLGVTVTKFVAESKRLGDRELATTIKAANSITLFTGSVLGLVIVLFAPFISDSILANEGLTNPLRISGLYLFFNSLNVYQLGVIAGLEAFRQLARINLIMGFLTLPILLSATYFGGLEGTLWGLTIHLIINWYLNRALIIEKVAESGITVVKSKVSTRIKELVRFSYPLALKEIIYSLSNWAVFYLLLINTDFAQVGVFNSAYQLAQLILFLPASVLTVFLSILSHQTDNRQNYNQLIRKNLILTFIITAGVGLGIIVFSGFIYKFYGISYEGGEVILYILTVATIPMALIGVLEQVCISSSNPTQVTVFQFLIQFLILASTITLFHFYVSAESLAYAILIGNSISFAVMYYYLKRTGSIQQTATISQN